MTRQRHLRLLGVTTAVLAVVVLVALHVRRATDSPPATGGTGFSIAYPYWVIVSLLGLLEGGLLLLSVRGDGPAPGRRLLAVGAAAGGLAFALGLLSGHVLLLEPASRSSLARLQNAAVALSMLAALVGMTGTLLGGLLALVHVLDERTS